MRKIQVLLAFIAIISTVLITGLAFAEDVKAQGQPFLSLQQQIDELKTQIAAIQSSKATVRVYDSSVPRQYIGINQDLRIFLSGLNLFARIYPDGDLGGNIESLYVSSDCTGNPLTIFENASEIVGKIGTDYYAGMSTVPTLNLIRSFHSQDTGICRTSEFEAYTLPLVKVDMTALPFTLPIVLPLKYVSE